MPTDSALKITGLREVQKSLFSYNAKLGNKVVSDSLRKGINLIARQGRWNAPKRTGRLRKNIITRKSKLRKAARGEFGAYATLRTRGNKNSPKNAYYGRWIHNGWRTRGGTRVAGEPFMEDAFMQQRRQATNLAVALMRRGAEVLARKEKLK